MSENVPNQPPRPLLVGLALCALSVLGFIGGAVYLIADGQGGAFVLPLLIAAAIGIVTYGAWRRQRGGWYVLSAGAVFSLLTGFFSLFDSDGLGIPASIARVVVSGAIAWLLIIPASSRDYYRDEAPEESPAQP